MRDDVERQGRKDELLWQREMPDDVERQSREELLWREDVRTSTSRRIKRFSSDRT